MAKAKAKWYSEDLSEREIANRAFVEAHLTVKEAEIFRALCSRWITIGSFDVINHSPSDTPEHDRPTSRQMGVFGHACAPETPFRLLISLATERAARLGHELPEDLRGTLFVPLIEC